MKKTVVALFLLISCSSVVFAQRRCGIEAQKAAMMAQDPAWKQKFEAQRSSLQSIADNYAQHKNESAQRTTSVPTVPVIFHIIVTNNQLSQMGGIAGIEARISSQIDVLNEDFNKNNADGSLIPSGWVPLYASTGIHFGLAHTQPNGYGTPGYELQILPGASNGFNGGGFTSYGDAKHAATGGLDAWDNTKYMNVWCINFLDDSGLLGTTVPISFTGLGGQPANEVGVAMKFLSLGRRTSASDLYPPASSGSYDLGRTLTHEVGHVFEIWHTWGDDGGACPWAGGADDGLADTPPESDHKFNNPSYTISGGTINDACQYNGSTNVQPIGVAVLDFLNYTDDIGMHLFTTDQANAMAAMVLTPPGSGTGADGEGTTGESYSLTQNPILLTWPANTGVQQTTINNSFNVSPNPTQGIVNITFDAQADQLKDISVVNVLGQQVVAINVTDAQKDVYSIDLSGMSKGIYLVRCNFASGIITRKILLQ